MAVVLWTLPELLVLLRQHATYTEIFVFYPGLRLIWIRVTFSFEQTSCEPKQHTLALSLIWLHIRLGFLSSSSFPVTTCILSCTRTEVSSSPICHRRCVSASCISNGVFTTYYSCVNFGWAFEKWNTHEGKPGTPELLAFLGIQVTIFACMFYLDERIALLQ